MAILTKALRRLFSFLGDEHGGVSLGLSIGWRGGGGGGSATSTTITDESTNVLTDESAGNLMSSGA